jgi:hypothetical protein
MVGLNLKVIDVEKRGLLAQNSQIEKIIDDPMANDPIMAAMERLVNSIAIRLSPLIIGSYDESADETNIFEIELRGLKSFEQFRMFKKFLQEEVPGINSVTQTRIKGNSMTVQVQLSGTREQFLEKIKGNEKFPFLADIDSTERGGIVIQIK